jgi:hypothetical protein
MVAEKDFTSGTTSTKAPPFEELNFKKFKKFFLSFLMRHDRAHLAITSQPPVHISDLNKQIPREHVMTEAQYKRVKTARRTWKRQNEIAYSYLMEVCNVHPKACTTAALYEGNDAKGLLQALEERFLNVEKNTVQAEVTKFNSMKITSNQSGAEFVDSIEAQAKVLENLGRRVSDDDKLTRLKEGLTDKRYTHLAHSLYTANDMTYSRASSLIKGYENTSFGKHAMQKSGDDEVNATVDDSKWKDHKKKSRCNKCKKTGHFARECRTPQYVIDRMKGGKHKKDQQSRGDNKSTVPRCDLCDTPGHSTKDCFHLKDAKFAVASKKRGADSRKDRHTNKERKKMRVKIDDSDEGSGSESNVLVEGEVNMAQSSSEDIYLDCGCNKMLLTSKKYMKNVQVVDREMLTANKGTLKIKGTGSAGNFSNVYYAPDASRNLVDMKSVTAKNCTVTFDEDEVIIRNKSTNKTLIRQRSVNGLYPVRLEDLLQLGVEFAGTAATETPSVNKCTLWHKRLGHVHNDKLIESDRRNLIEGINLDKKYFRKKYKNTICKCNTCMRAKLTRKNFRTPLVRINLDGNSKEKGVISADIFEVLNTPSMEGFKHGLQFKHKDAKKVYVYGLVSKSGDEVLKCMKDLVEVQLVADGLQMKRYHADGAGELIGKHIRNYLRENKSTRTTKVTWTPRNTPEMNSISERANRTLKEMALALLLDSGLPSIFWFKAVQHAVHLINLLPTKTSKGYISPAEYTTGEPSDVRDLKIWGCKAWAIVPKEQRRKEWKDKGKPGYYMGVSTQPIGHRIYIPDLDDEIVTVHANFDEQIPDRPSEYYDEIDNLAIEMSDKSEDVNDFKYLEGLKHVDGLLPYVTTRVIVRKGLIVGFRKLDREGNDVEEQTPIHVKDIEKMTHESNHSDRIFDSLRKETEEEEATTTKNVDGEKHEKNNSVSSTDKTETRSRKKRNLLNVGILGDTSLFLTSSKDIISEPATLAEAKKSSYRKYWIQATRKEIYKLERRACWKVTRQPKDRKIIKSKLVFKVKRDYMGRVKKFKVRLVAKGFTQEEGVDYKETFSPVAKGVSFRLAIALALRHNLHLRQLDVETAFPYADLEEDVFMSPPAGISVPKGHCLKILKSLYGLKQAPRNWYNLLRETIKSMGYQQCVLDPCLFVQKGSGDQINLILVYVDDIIVLSDDESHTAEVINKFNTQYAMQDLGDLQHYLGLTIEKRDDGTIKLHQTAYAKDVVSRFSHLLSDRKRRNRTDTPLPPGIKLSKEAQVPETSKQKAYAQEFPYQSVIGALMYLAVHTRPDLAYTVNLLSRFNSRPTYAACQAALHTLVYLEETIDQGIIFPNSIDSDPLEVYSDADWAGDLDTSRSTTGYIVFLWGAPIAWQSRLQPTVATSTMEAEYMAAYAAIQEIVWIRGVMTELGLKGFELSGNTSPTILNMDSKSAIDLAQNPVNHKRSKHIRIKYHWIREQVGGKVVKLNHVPTVEMRADMMTKSLPEKLHRQHMKSVVC